MVNETYNWVVHLKKCNIGHYADLDHKDCLEIAELLEQKDREIERLKKENEELKCKWNTAENLLKRFNTLIKEV